MCDVANQARIYGQLAGESVRERERERVEEESDPSHASSVCTCDVRPDSDFTGGRSQPEGER